MSEYRTNVTLREQRAKLIYDARLIYDTCDREKREPTADETRKFNSIIASADKIEAEYTAAETAQGVNRSQPLETWRRRLGRDEARDGDRKRWYADQKAADEIAAVKYIREGLLGLNDAERRHLQADNDTASGYMVLPQRISDLVIVAENKLAIRQLATTVETLGAQSVGASSIDTDVDDGEWSQELSAGNDDSAMRTGKRELHPHAVARRIKVSAKLLRNGRNAEAIVAARLGYKLSVPQEKGFMTGDGVKKPLGMFVASDDGIPTSRDVATGSATDLTADGLIDAKFSLKAQYLESPNCRWILHRDAMKKALKLKSTDGNYYLLQPSVVPGTGDTLLGIPVVLSEYAPATFTTGLYVGIIGDLSKYLIADSLSVSIQRIDELYAVTDEVGFFGRAEVDGMPGLAEAFARLKTN